MTGSHSILDDLLTEHGITITESATRADVQRALNQLNDALELERIAASTTPSDEDRGR